MIQNEQGYDLNELNKFHEAIQCFDKAIEIDPQFSKAYFNKGTSLNALNKYQESYQFLVLKRRLKLSQMIQKLTIILEMLCVI
jgi:tetratricopeptide (TPR) repeat protein